MVTTAGRDIWNLSPVSNRDGLEGKQDVLFCLVSRGPNDSKDAAAAAAYNVNTYRLQVHCMNPLTDLTLATCLVNFPIALPVCIREHIEI